MGTERKSVMRTLRRAALRGTGAEPTDAHLLGRFIEHRDETAFEALVRRHGSMVLGVCRRVLCHGQDAEDAFQAVFIVLLRKAGSIRKRELVGAWLYGVAHQTARKARASAAKRRARERQVEEMPEPGAADHDPCDDLLPLLDRELSRLPDRYRVPIVLCELEGKTHKEAARQLGCPEGTVSGRLSRGRAMLARRLGRCGVATTAGAVAAALSRGAASAASPPLVEAAVRAALQGGAAAAPAHALAGAVVKSLLLQKIRGAAAALFVAGLLLLGAGTVACRAFPADRGPPASPAGPPPETTSRAAPPLATAEPADGETYLLINADSGRCLSVHDREKYTAMIVQGPVPESAGLAERWKLVRVGDYFQLVNGNSGMALAIPPDHKERGAQPLQERLIGPEDRETPVPPGNDDPPRMNIGGFPQLRIEDEMWRLVKTDNYYAIEGRLSHMALGQAAPFDGLELYEQRPFETGRRDQLWILRRAAEVPTP